jgi:hypothetical protein
MVRKYDFELFETEEHDIKLVRDFTVAKPQAGARELRVVVAGAAMT